VSVATGAVLARLRADLRTLWRSWVAIALIAGVGTGIGLGLLAGAARSENAYREFSDTMQAADAVVAGSSAFGLVGSVDLDDVARLPQVEDMARAHASFLFTGRTSSGRRIGPVDLFPVIPDDAKLRRSVERSRIDHGRRADPDSIDEATASFILAENLGLEVGDTVRLRFIEAASFPTAANALLSQFGDRLAGAPGAGSSAIDQLADGPDVTLRIVGIEASPAEFPPLGPDLAPTLQLTRAFGREYGDRIVSSPLGFVRLRETDAASFDAFAKEVERLAGEQQSSIIQSRLLHTPKVERAIRVQSDALRIVAFVLFVAMVLVVGQTCIRRAAADARDNAVLRALGMRRLDLLALVAARGALVGVFTAVIAVVVAVGVSRFMPIGIARTAELDRGIAVDLSVLAFGALAIVLVVLVLRVVTWQYVDRRARRTDEPPSAVSMMVDRSSLPPSAGIGVRFALDRGREAAGVPVWVSVLGVTLSFALLGGLWCFRAGLDHLLDSPPLYGWNWSVRIGAPALPDVSSALVPAFVHDPSVVGVAEGAVTQAELGLERVDVLGMHQVVGVAAPTIIEGRLPRGPREILAGTTTLERAGLEVGDLAVVRLGNRAAGLRVVGRGVFPEFGEAGRLGNGVFMTYDGLERLLPAARRNVFLISFRNETPDEVQHLRQAVDPLPTRDSGRPRELEELSRVSGLPTLLGVLVALLSAATLSHTLVISVRRRSRDLAVLRTLGFVRRQVGAAVMWQTTTLVLIGLAIGLPLGALIGRFAWSVFADGLGAVPVSPIAWVPLALTLPVALVLANLVALVPAWIAMNQSVAESMRSE
jgi:ABC-type lipoprotein release transport system permease subunit